MSFISARMAGRFAARDFEEVQDKATTIRPSSTALFCVDSDDRYKTYSERRTNPSYPFTFSISKNESLLNGFFSRLGLTEFRLNWTLPNISAAWGNNTITITSGGNPYVFTLPDGFYDLQTLCTTLEGLVQAGTSVPASAGVLPTFVAVPSLDGSVAFASGGVQTFFFPAPTANIRTLYDMLNVRTTAPATTQQGGIVNLRATDFIDVVCSQLTYNQDLKDGTSAPTNRDMLTRIYLDESVPSLYRTTTLSFPIPAGPATSELVPQTDFTDRTNGSTPFVIYRQFTQPKQIKWDDSQPIGNLVFELYDDQGRSLQDLWASTYPPSSSNLGRFYSNSFIWNFTLLVSEN